MVVAVRRHVSGVRRGARHLVLLSWCGRGWDSGRGKVGGFMSLLELGWLVLVLERMFWNGGHWLCEDSRLAGRK